MSNILHKSGGGSVNWLFTGISNTLKKIDTKSTQFRNYLTWAGIGALSLSIMALTQLLYPLQYMFPMIPILPTSMPGSEQLLLAPTPYLIGLPSSFLKYNKLPQVPDDVWLIDLDAAVIKPPSNPNTDNTIPALPSPDGGLLRSQLKQVFIIKT